MDNLTLPTKDLKGYQEETLLDGELVWDERKKQMVYYIFDGIMFMAKNLAGFDLNGRLQAVQNGVIGPLQARDERNSKREDVDVSIYEKVFPFRMKMKQMWKPYGLKELFDRVIPAQGHENDGLIFTPVKDAYQCGTCHRLLKWKPSDMNSVDFLMVNEKGGGGWQLFIATQGRVHYYSDFYPLKDESLMRSVKEVTDLNLNGKIAEFRMNLEHENKWTFMRFRPDKRLPNDSKTVEKVLQSIKDNVKKDDLLEREGKIRSNWKSRESQSIPAVTINGKSNTGKTLKEEEEIDISIIPRSQLVNPKVPFSYPLNLRTEKAKSSYSEYDGWYQKEESSGHEPKKRTKLQE